MVNINILGVCCNRRLDLKLDKTRGGSVTLHFGNGLRGPYLESDNRQETDLRPLLQLTRSPSLPLPGHGGFTTPEEKNEVQLGSKQIY